MRGLLALVPLLSVTQLSAAQLGHGQAIAASGGLPLRPLPPLPAPTSSLTPQPQSGSGSVVRINGQAQQARWQLENGELWLPLEVLEGQLGASRRQGESGTLQLDWFGQRLDVPASRQRSLDDEVAVPALALLDALGIRLSVQGRELALSLPETTLLGIRSRDLGSGSRRVVLDLAGPSLVRSGDGHVRLSVRSSGDQLGQLQALGLAPRQEGPWLALEADGQRLSLASPWRLVLDLPGDAAAGQATGTPAVAPARDPRLLALLNQGLVIERRSAELNGQQLVLHSVRLDPQQVPLDLRPLNRPDGMQGLSSLSQLARQEQAVVAINGGYFNRVNRLPLGALRDEGRWLSGPILNRGAIGWSQAELPQFGRLSLVETLEDSQGQRWPLAGLNTGYVQRGLAHYTADWGRSYQPLSGGETAIVLRQGTVVRRLEAEELAAGVPLTAGDDLVVARGGLPLPWGAGERLQLISRPSHPLGSKPYVIGGGPLLLQNGQVVLNGVGEGFSAAFLSQGAPRTVIASDGRQLWLITLQGLNGVGPSLMETALVLQRQGLRDALNLDGGSSTGLVLGQEQTVKGRGVAAAVHNGLGLVPREQPQSHTGPLSLGGARPSP